jgi:stearoyl-CoA desaturase (delta-9 desaturase)
MSTSSSRIPIQRINWITSFFLAGTMLISLVGVPLYLWHFGIDFFQIALFIFFVYATGMSITLGYHRLYSHRAFEAKTPVRLWTLIFGACAFENSALDWVADHRIHHKHTDHDEDPYDISKGFFWAHIGWLLVKLHPDPHMDNVADMRKDKLVMWQHKYVQLIAVVFGFLLPAAIGYVWNGWVGALGSFLFSGVLRVVVVQHSTFFINSLCHTVGRRPYSSGSSARDSGLMAFFTFGEGYHNYHHTFQYDYRNGIKKFSFDPTKWAIWLLSTVGLTTNLKRVPVEKIVLAEMAEARRQAAAHIEAGSVSATSKVSEQYGKMMEYLHQLSEGVTESYHELEEVVKNRAQTSRETINAYRAETRELLDHIAHIGALKASPAFA